MQEFANWLATTGPSVFIQEHYTWAIPLLQSIHLMGIAVVFGSVFLMTLRLLGLAGTDQPMLRIAERFGGWLKWGLIVLAISGGLLIVGEPVREVMTFSFWMKMTLVAFNAIVGFTWIARVKKNPQAWDGPNANLGSAKLMAVLMFLVFIAIIFLGRLIAYDQIWGDWSPLSA